MSPGFPASLFELLGTIVGADVDFDIQKGDKVRRQQRITIFFASDKLNYFTGDFVPSSIGEQANDEPTEKTPKA